MSISIKQAKEILNKSGEKMTELQIQELIYDFVVLSDLAIDSFLAKRNNQKFKNQTITLNEN